MEELKMVSLNGLKMNGEEGYPDITDGEHFGFLESSVEKAKTQTYINFTFKIAEGRFKGRIIWHMAFITGRMSSTGFAFINKLKEACGKPDATDTDELNNIGILIKTELVEDTYKGGGALKATIVDLIKTDKVFDLESLKKKEGKVSDDELNDIPF